MCIVTVMVVRSYSKNVYATNRALLLHKFAPRNFMHEACTNLDDQLTSKESHLYHGGDSSCLAVYNKEE